MPTREGLTTIEEAHMDPVLLILIIVVVVLLLGGGGYRHYR